MIESDFIPIGEKTNTGDAILCHFTDPGSYEQKLMLIDGGFAETAEAIASHMRDYYNTDRINLMVCTHPDNDHITGLFGLFDLVDVDELLIHQPSAHGFTSDDVKAGQVDELITLAKRKNTTVTTEAFDGSTFFNGAVMMAGPSRDYYKELLGEGDQSNSIESLVKSILRASAAAVKPADPPHDRPGGG
ncbi:MBL fold metallo-hydrolase [Curtobacterium flaccumfaciens pv. oortii]|uniref:MBL fold metallo-hydrolase n=1 Tax=Curtobacterium flaccumfaciens TaxID=2035 RepID=UPI002658E730|nr:MBL fold metallo-hydrolase [Curtobacterium flaccumfaciens]MCS5521212.1 MBL fold metallo-hydrolase [Curtobacterium flaccumfaciens pv. oortii]